MTGPSGNSDFCFPSTSLRVSGKQNSLFPLGPVIECLFNVNGYLLARNIPVDNYRLNRFTFTSLKFTKLQYQENNSKQDYKIELIKLFFLPRKYTKLLFLYGHKFISFLTVKCLRQVFD